MALPSYLMGDSPTIAQLEQQDQLIKQRQGDVNQLGVQAIQGQYQGTPDWWASDLWSRTAQDRNIAAMADQPSTFQPSLADYGSAGQMWQRYGMPEQRYYDPNVDQFESDWARNKYQQLRGQYGDTAWSNLTPEQQRELEYVRISGEDIYQDKRNLGPLAAGLGVVTLGAALPALLGGGAAAGAAGAAGAGAAGAGAGTAAGLGGAGMGAAGMTGAGLGGTALTGTLGTGIAAPTLGAGLSLGVPTLAVAPAATGITAGALAKGALIGGGLGLIGSGGDPKAALRGAATGAGGAALGGAAGGNVATSNKMGLKDWLSLGGDVLGAYGSYRAGEQQQDAINQALAQQRMAGQFGMDAYAPYTSAGVEGLSGLRGMRGYDPTTDPQYQNQLAEMSRVMNARSAAAGLGQSSADLLQRAAATSDLYGQSYGREYNRLADLVNLGQYGTTGQVGAQMGQAQGMSNLQLMGGQASGNQLANLYGNIGDVMALPAQMSLNREYIQALNRA